MARGTAMSLVVLDAHGRPGMVLGVAAAAGQPAGDPLPSGPLAPHLPGAGHT